jgi:hypothetical protein
MAAGDFSMSVLQDKAGTLAGMIAWETPSPHSVGFLGPFVFGGTASGRDAAGLLTRHMIRSVARTPALIVYSILATPDLPPGEFELLASLDRRFTGRETGPLWFRHLGEDMGRSVWSHPSMTGFLRETYDRLFLMRTINETRDSGQSRPERSLIAAELDPGSGEAVLRPMLDGSDITENLRRHVNLLRSEGYTSIAVILDLALGWQAAMGGALTETGFLPAYVLPHAGDSDKAVFHHVLPEP